jgi:hypothetical protein
MLEGRESAVWIGFFPAINESAQVISNALRFTLFISLLVLFAVAGCAEGVPEWAMHVRPGHVDPDSATDTVAGTLLRELKDFGHHLPDGHLAPEEIASVALREIADGHQADAALWLAMASYRYHQEAFEAIRKTRTAQVPRGVNMKAYANLIRNELERYNHLNFDNELSALRARVYGRTEVEKALQEQVAVLGKTTAIEREALRDALWELRPSAAAAEASRYPLLVEAFRHRLRADFAGDTRDEHPAIYLAWTPYGALQAEALAVTVGFFEPPVCAALADAFPLLRPTVIAALTSTRPQTRANAAVVLGLAPSQETRVLLEQRLAGEPDPKVKLALQFALVHHGATEQMQPFTAVLQSCEGASCTLPVMLSQWLPATSKVELDQSSLARIVVGTQYEPRAHMFAAAVLRDIGRQKALDPATVEALIVAGRRRLNETDERAASLAFDAVADSALLSRAAVIARIDGHGLTMTNPQRDVLFPGPLLGRLAKVSTIDDLPLLTRLMDRFGDTKGPEPDAIVDAALHIPGREADTRLLRWFDRYANLRLHIAVGLVGRATVSRAEIYRIGERGGASVQIVTHAMLQGRDTETILSGYLRDEIFSHQLAAAELAGLIEQNHARDDLRRLLSFNDAHYYPNDVLVRHAAMVSLVRMALVATKPAPVTTVGAQAPAPPDSTQ